MITSNITDVFVWTWLPGEVEPVVAGRIQQEGHRFFFTYGRSYRERDNAIPFSPFELPLEAGTFEPQGLNVIHSSLRDGAPDAWGRRLVDYQCSGMEANELDYMLYSGSDRIGALDFQKSSTEYQPRGLEHLELAQLLEAASLFERNQPLPPELENALVYGANGSGGARPKALINDGDNRYIAKFSSITDTYNVVKGEYVAMRLAKLAGIHVAEVLLQRTVGRDVLLVKRFDRTHSEKGTLRHAMLSGLSLLGLNEMEARYASYKDLADVVRQRFSKPRETLEDLYGRLVFNILIGNTDDHARNHAAFWDGKALSLTPAYDLCPQARTGQEATQAMRLDGAEGNHATLSNVLSICESFQLDVQRAEDIINTMRGVIEGHWLPVCDEAKMTDSERERLWQRAVLNPYCLQGWD